MINKTLLDILVCPEDHSSLTPANSELVERLNQQIERGELNNQAGQAIKEKIDGGLVRADGQFLYPIRDDIPIMLIEERILLG